MTLKSRGGFHSFKSIGLGMENGLTWLSTVMKNLLHHLDEAIAIQCIAVFV